MRNFLDGGRKKRRSTRFRTKFARDRAGTGGKRLVRFRRNRELIAREITNIVLWASIAVMLMLLGRTLWKVSQQHLSERETLIQVALPGIALLAAVGAAWRARSSLRELQDIRSEQAQLMADLQSDLNPQNEP